MSLLISSVGALTAFAINASPAMALSINPDAASPGIEDANTLHWILFVVILLVIVVVNLGILRAARPRIRATESKKPRRGPSQARLAVGLGVFALAIFVVSTVFSDKSREVPASTETVAGQADGKPLEIVATGQQWLWRFNYPNDSFSYRRLIVPTGVTVRLELESSDVIHGWNVPELTGKAQAVPGQTNDVFFRADDPGVYHSRSSVFSGQGYDTMEIEVQAVSPDEYEAAIAKLKREIQAAQDKVETQFQATQEESAATDARDQQSGAANNQADVESAEAE